MSSPFGTTVVFLAVIAAIGGATYWYVNGGDVEIQETVEQFQNADLPFMIGD